MEQIKETEFSYPKYFRIGGIFITIFMIYFGLRLLIFCYKLVDTMLKVPSDQIALSAILFSTFLFISAFFIPIIWSNWWMGFTIGEHGITFQVFRIWEVLVSWDDINEVRKGSIPWGKSFIVIANKLTVFHRIIGLVYGFTLKPAFVIDSPLENREEALKLIRFGIENKKSAS